jgi:alpha-beta hydrolase superfamily lysophospholipase
MKVVLALLLFALLVLPGACFASVVREDDCNLVREIGSPLYVWRDPELPRPSAILIAVHGSAQEGAVMGGLARVLVPQGYFVVAPDVRGNGRWQKLKLPPQMADQQLMASGDDVAKILAILNRDYPGTDIFCAGESIGAGIVLKAVSMNPRSVRGVILVSAGVRPHMHNPLNMSGSFIKDMAMLTEPTDLRDYVSRYCSEDPRVIQEMLNDPLAKNRQSGLDLIGTFSFLRQEPKFAAMMPMDIPVLAIQGTADQIVEPSSINELLEALHTSAKRLVMIPGCGHVIIGTSYLKPLVLNCIESFLQEHRSALSGPIPTNMHEMSNEPSAPSDMNRELVNPTDFSQAPVPTGRAE